MELQDPDGMSFPLPVTGSVAMVRNQCVEDTHPGSVLKLPGWLKTGRRTRPGKALTMLIPGSDQDLSVPHHDGTYDLETVQQNLPLKKRKFEQSLLSNVRKTGRPRSENDGRIVNPGLETTACKVPVRARKHHVCDLCERSFRSYQALGGHKAHHKDDLFSANVDSLVVRAERKRGCCSLVHRCPFCNKSFSKGQALGGHKRHCRRPGDETTYPGGGQVGLDESMMLSFDLNELPPESVPEEMV